MTDLHSVLAYLDRVAILTAGTEVEDAARERVDVVLSAIDQLDRYRDLVGELRRWATGEDRDQPGSASRPEIASARYLCGVLTRHGFGDPS